MDKKTACVVGAGAAGIAALKECIRQGFETVCFELDSDIGGIWHKKDYSPANTPAIWDTLNTNTSKFNTCYSDFPPRTTDTPYLTAEAMFDYYKRAVEHFDLGKYIQLNTRVIKIRKTSEHERTGQWDVFTAASGSDVSGTALAGPRGDETTLSRCHKRVFDFVFICTGYFKLPSYPAIPGIQHFRGDIQHSFNYTSGKPYTGKRVLVVGNQFSGLDIAGDVSNHASRVYLALGQGTWILPRCFSNSRPFDFFLSRSVMYSRNATAEINEILISEAQYKFSHDETCIRPQGPPLTSTVGFSDELQIKILCGRVQACERLAQLEEDKAHFENGTTISGIDAIIFCTGYKPDFSFLDLDIIQENGKMELYRMTFPLGEKHRTLALIGQFAGDFALANLFDLQARLATRVMAGKQNLPSYDKMKADVDFWNAHTQFRRGSYKSYFIAVATLMDAIAMEIGCYPSFWKVFCKNPVLAYRNWYGPIMSAQYRLLGPDSQWEAAEKTCLSQYEEGYSSVRRL